MSRSNISSYELECRTEDIIVLQVYGFDVEQLTPYHFRIDGALDLYPVNFKYHNIQTQTRGKYDREKVVDLAFKELKNQ